MPCLWKKNRAIEKEFFIARIHGRVEKPQSVILYPSSYQALGQNEIYKDFWGCFARSLNILTNLMRCW